MTIDWAQLKRAEDGGRRLRIGLPHCSEPVEVVLETDKEPSRAQMEAVEELIRNWPALHLALARPLFAYYRSTLVAATDVEPTNAREEDIWSHAAVHEIRCPTQTSEGHRYIRIGGSCSWEEEHGLEILVRNGSEIIYLGSHNGGDVSMEPSEDEWWNFAISKNQEAALAAEDPLTDEEIAELAVSADDPMEGSSSQRAPAGARQTKPWWRLW